MLTCRPLPAIASPASLQVGPRMSFSTAWCANALSICSSCGLSKVDRIEVSRRFLLRASAPLEAPERAAFAALVHDRMTEQVYPQALTSFASDTVPAPVATIPVVAEGRAALERINKVGGEGWVRRVIGRAECGGWQGGLRQRVRLLWLGVGNRWEGGCMRREQVVEAAPLRRCQPGNAAAAASATRCVLFVLAPPLLLPLLHSSSQSLFLSSFPLIPPVLPAFAGDGPGL